MTRAKGLVGCRITLLALALVALIGSAAAAVTLQQEIEIGRKVDAEILKQVPLSTDQAAIKEMDELGQQIAKHVRRPEIKYTFRILNEGDQFDAFSIPGGYVYFSQRTWDMMRRDERTGVLGHEITHVDRRHAIDAMIKAQKRQIWATVLLTAVGANEAVASMANLANSLSTLKYSRGDEKQADENSVDLCQMAGFNPAGIYLAMIKLERMAEETGGDPPKILSTHPLTKDRVEYLQKLLASKGIAVPAEQPAQDLPGPDKIGQVISVNSDTIDFTSGKPLRVGDVVWIMHHGWDYRYENRTWVPAARGVVTSSGVSYTAKIWATPTAHPKDVAANAGVYAPIVPAPDGEIAVIEPTLGGGKGKLSAISPLRKFDRALAYQSVYDRKAGQFAESPVGYIVVTDPASPAGYVSVQRPQYSYAPVDVGSTLVRLSDPDADKWAGMVTSVGKASQALEVLPSRDLVARATYQVAIPAWNKDDPLSRRVIATAAFLPTDKKMVLRIVSFSPGYAMADIRNGFDIYEEPAEK